MGTWTRVETRGRTNDANEDGSGNENKCSSEDENGTEMGTGTGTRTGFGGEAKKRKKSHKRCRRDEGNREHVNGKGRKRRQERFGSVTADPGLKKKLYKSRGCVPCGASDQRFS